MELLTEDLQEEEVLFWGEINGHTLDSRMTGLIPKSGYGMVKMVASSSQNDFKHAEVFDAILKGVTIWVSE